MEYVEKLNSKQKDLRSSIESIKRNTQNRDKRSKNLRGKEDKNLTQDRVEAIVVYTLKQLSKLKWISYTFTNTACKFCSN